MVPKAGKKAATKDNNIDEVKLVIVGDTKVGKTTIIESLSGMNVIGRGYSVSLEVVLSKKKIFTGRIYDLRSQRYFPYLHSLYYHGAKGAIIVFDVTNRDSFNSIKKWLEIIWGHVGSIPILLCGNKSDLRYNISEQVSIEEVKVLTNELAAEHADSVHYIEISALKNIVAVSDIACKDEDAVEDIYPTTEAFRKPFLNWLFEILKKG